MQLTYVRAQHVRNHRDVTVALSDGLSVILGDNGSGKTSVIEALYVALRGKSFRGSLREIISSGQQWARIEIGNESAQRVCKITIEPDANRAKKSFEGSSFERAIVLFEPAHMQLFHGSPERRRRWLDEVCIEFFPHYKSSLLAYRRALQQRNALLKNDIENSESYFAWELTLAQHAAILVRLRQQMIESLAGTLPQEYSTIAGRQDEIEIRYATEKTNGYESWLLQEFEHQRSRHQQLGTTPIGPHRDDIELLFNARPITESASRGETRSVILALKIIEIELQKKRSVIPLLLLDDVFGELDESHRKHLARRIQSVQTVLTSTHADHIQSMLQPEHTQIHL